MAGKGHEERLPPPRLSGRCRLGEATFPGMGGKEEDAPKAVVRLVCFSVRMALPTDFDEAGISGG